MSALRALANMLGVAPRLAEDALHSERAAKAVLSRRNLFAAAGAMAAGTVFCPPIEVIAAPVNPWAMAPQLALSMRVMYSVIAGLSDRQFSAPDGSSVAVKVYQDSP